MKLFLPAVFTAAVAATPVTAQPASALMRFANADQIAGKLQAITTDGLTWNSGILAKPALFPVDQVVDVTLPSTAKAPESEYVATIVMKNGDVVRGTLLAVEPEAILLDTWYAGPLRLNRPMVEEIKIDPLKQRYFVGPTSLDGWVQSGDEPAWEYRHQAFIGTAAGSIARDQMLTEECSVSFDAQWRSDSIGLKVLLFSNDITSTDPTSGYELTFQRANAYLRKKGERTSYLGNARCSELSENNRVHIEIRASIRSGKIALLIDGTIAEVWSDPDHENGLNHTGFHLVTTASNPAIRISNINISPWDGRVDDIPDPQLTESETKTEDGDTASHSMQLANGDRIDGEVVDVRDGLISIKGPLGEFDIPITRFRSLNLPGLGLERCIRRKGDIRASFPDGSSLVFRFDSTDGTTITGSSQNFGTASFKLSTISHIEFNLYDRNMKAIRQQLQW